MVGKKEEDRYVAGQVPESMRDVVYDRETETPLTTEQALSLILNKLDKVIG